MEPNTHKALVLHSSDKPLSLERVPIPRAKSGSVVVKVLSTQVVPYMSQVLDGSLPYPLVLPLTPGSNAIGRIYDVGPDSVKLKPGQLVFCEITIRARDDPNSSILYGLFGGTTPSSRQLMEGEWRDASYAEYCAYPIENVYPLNEEILTKVYKYTINDLCFMPIILVPFGGLSDVNTKPGEVVVVAPATGRFSGGAVAMALAMGATVIAAGRNKEALSNLEKIFSGTGRIKTVALSGNDEAANTQALLNALPYPDVGADVFIDLSPPEAAGSTMLTSAIRVVRPNGRIVVMGGIRSNVEIPYLELMLKSIRLQGKFMYDREQIKLFIQMLESGIIKLGQHIGINPPKSFSLEDVSNALSESSKLKGWGDHVVLNPN